MEGVRAVASYRVPMDPKSGVDKALLRFGEELGQRGP